MTPKVLVVGGLLLAVLSALFVSALAPVVAQAAVPGFVGNILPWLVGGAGILAGFLNTSRKTKTALFSLIGLAFALPRFLPKPLNPAWLGHFASSGAVFSRPALLSP